MTGVIIEIPDHCPTRDLLKEVVRKGFDAAKRIGKVRARMEELRINVDGGPLEDVLLSGLEAVYVVTPQYIRERDDWNYDLHDAVDFDAFWAKYYEHKEEK